MTLRTAVSVRVAACGLAVLAATAVPARPAMARANDEYAGQFNYGQTREKGKSWVQSIRVLNPAYRSDVSGTVTITFEAPRMEAAEARCWHQPDRDRPGPWGYDAVVMEPRRIDGNAATSFEFPADEFPHGPTNVRISTTSRSGKRDVCELQLFNTGGVRWNQGIPKSDPPGAKGMGLVFTDDFDKMPAISPDGSLATYAAHKPPHGDFSGWRFSHKDDFAGAHDPFEQIDTWLRIKARKSGPDRRQQGSGIISSAHFDGGGFYAVPPCYLECRFVAQSAPGTWPAFWTLAVTDDGCDELDIIEGYGGVGRGNPNATDYHIVTHLWGQKDARGKQKKGFHRQVPVMKMGGKSFWSTTAHTYAVMIGVEETVYYFDDTEVLRHPSGPISASEPAFFLVNYAIGGISGWKIDLDRYDNGSDMWVDYVRVYSQTAPTPTIAPGDGFIFGKTVKVTMRCPLPDAKIHYTTDGSDPTPRSRRYRGPLSIRRACGVKAIVVADGLKPGRIGTARIRGARPADAPQATRPGLSCAHYEGRWEKVPPFDKLKPTFTATTRAFEFPARSEKDYFALEYAGFVEVPADGVYTFYTNSDDGSQLLIGGEVVVDNDGYHGPREAAANAGLMAGKHAIEVRFFEAAGGETLSVSWSGPDIEKELVPAAALSHAPAAGDTPGGDARGQ